LHEFYTPKKRKKNILAEGARVIYEPYSRKLSQMPELLDRSGTLPVNDSLPNVHCYQLRKKAQVTALLAEKFLLSIKYRCLHSE
jgi:hypothetical protein